MPKEIRFVNAADFPRSSTGKIQRHEVEKWLSGPATSPPKGPRPGVA